MTLARVCRLLLVLASALIVVWSFVDVGARAWNARDGAGGRDITLTILHWGDADEVKIMEGLVTDYEKQNPRIRIQRIHAGDYDSKLKTMFASGASPDLFYLGYERVPEMAGLGLLKPIDDLIDYEKRAGRGEWINDFFPILIDAFRYDGSKSGAGPLYGLPKDFTTAVMYVNVDLFNRAAIPVPYDGWTWDEYESAVNSISALSTPDRRIYGGVLETWPAMLRLMLWTEGATFFANEFTDPDFRDVRLTESGAVRVVERVRRLRFDNGPAGFPPVYNTVGPGKDGGQEFFTGNIGVHGPLGRWRTPFLRTIPPKTGADDTDPTHVTWDVVPVPRGAQSASPVFTVAWTMSAQTKYPDEAFALMKFLCGPDGQTDAARKGLAIPSLKSVAYSDAFLNPGMPPNNGKAFLSAIDVAHIGQNPRQTEFMQILQDEVGGVIQLRATNDDGSFRTPEQAGNLVSTKWARELSSPLRTKQYTPMPWTRIGTVTAAVLALGVTLLWWKARQEKIGALDRSAEHAGWMFIAPWLIGFLLLTAGPMIVSLLLSFTRWTAMTPLGSAEFVGIDNFTHLATYDPAVGKSLIVTSYFVIIAVPLGQVAALAVALLMNARVRGITVFRTIYFVPSVISGMALATLWLWVFNKDFGLLNAFLRPVANLFGTTPPNWLGDDAARWAIPAFVIMGLWGVGGGMIIYLAGLKGIPQSLYEAATIDGAGPVRRFWNVTLPMLSPLIFYNLVMGLIGSFQIFTQAKVMTNGGPNNETMFYVLNLYRQAFEFHNMGYASALAWVLFLIVLALTIVVFKGSKNLVYYEGLKT